MTRSPPPPLSFPPPPLSSFLPSPSSSSSLLYSSYAVSPLSSPPSLLFPLLYLLLSSPPPATSLIFLFPWQEESKLTYIDLFRRSALPPPPRVLTRMTGLHDEHGWPVFVDVYEWHFWPASLTWRDPSQPARVTCIAKGALPPSMTCTIGIRDL